MRKGILLLLLVHVLLAFATLARAGGTRADETPRTATSDEDVARKAWIILETKLGDIVIALRPEFSRGRVARVAALVRVGAYDGVSIGRIDPASYVQVFSIQHRRMPPLPVDRHGVVRDSFWAA